MTHLALARNWWCRASKRACGSSQGGGLLPQGGQLLLQVGRVDDHAAAHHAAKAAHEQAIDLVKGEPVAHQALVFGHDGAGVVEVEIDELGILPAAVVFGQAIGQLVVAKGDHGLDALLLTGLEHAAVELDAGLVGLGLVAVGEDAAPVDGHAVALKAHLAKELDVVEIMMVHIHGLVAGIVVLGQNAVGNVARLGDRTASHDVGDTEALAVLVVSAFALIGGSGAAPQKSIGKSHVGSFRTCWDVTRAPKRRPQDQFASCSGSAQEPLPRNRPIYYVLPQITDHTAIVNNKTAGRRLDGFRKTAVWLVPAT